MPINMGDILIKILNKYVIIIKGEKLWNLEMMPLNN